MASTLTIDHIRSILDPCAKGDWGPLLNAIDENVKWWIAADDEDPDTVSGVYVCLSLLPYSRFGCKDGLLLI